ncbi:Protein mlp1 [Didymosphaeria variabile]|uniref:Protein mlp1 n=1 Tax=Didymosphaeria variabile TaxID=1932322 RepID=A0A9W8XXM8_9PLEO|nr:Protein mlp1 [Didymosphaeria variabile]KAJ4360640.1 Protein mlp1 [Didymosphaeria variabile]
MAATAVDVGYIAASYAIPETNIRSLLSEPSVELVQSLLVQIEAKAREYDELQSEKLRADIENETAVRAGEARARTLQATADKAVKDAEELRQQLAQKETAHQQLETQLLTLQASTSSSSSQVDVLEARVRSLESQNRDTVALHEAKSAAYDRLAEELSAQHQKLVALRKQVSELEDKKQELEAGAKDVTFRENNLRQEIDQLRSSNEWYEGELKTRSADNTRFRKEKNAQIAELQRANADATQTIDSLRSKETSQTKRVEELEQRVEQSLLRIQQLQEETAQNQQSFRAELDNSRRLAELCGEREKTAKKRLEEITDEFRDVKDAAAFEVGKLQAECDSEKSKVVQYEAKLAEVESLVETQESQLSELRTSVHVPHTPRRGMNGAFGTPARAGSPMISTPGGSKKGGLTVTQLYAENVKLKADLRSSEENRTELREQVNDMLQSMEEIYPELEERKQEIERLKSEFANLSGNLDDALTAKDAARKEARKKDGDIKGLEQRHQIDRQIITDITFQNKLLLLEQQRREVGLEALSPEDLRFLEETKDNTIPEHRLDQNDTPTSRSLTQHLVLYKNIDELVQRNHDLLQQVSNFTQVYEGRQAQEKLEEQERVKRELEEFREKAAQYEDRINSLENTVNLLTKERDLWRRTATNQGHRSGGSDAASIFDGTPPPGNSISNTQSAEAVQNSNLFKELQKSLDILREESVTDRATLKHQIDDLTKEIRQLQHENVRLESKQQVAQQWHDQQQHRIAALESQKDLLQKRLNAAQDQLASSDLKFQQVMEENVECRGQLESLERANTNLKASQSIWETTRNRLEGEIRTLNETKSLLNKSLEEKRNDYNEQTLMQAETRRLLESRASSLEVELSNAQRKLQDETEEHKRITIRFELDQTDKQRKIDDLLKAANEVRQELASVRTARDQLQVRVGELQSDLRLAEDRAQQAPRANGAAAADGEEEEEGFSHEEQLKVQLADLKRDYERTREKLETAETHIETYKNIAQEKEEQLESFVEAHDQMEQDLNRTLQEKESEIEDLKKRVEEFSSELATTSTELSNLRSNQEQEKLELTQQKEALEADIARIQSDVNEYEAAMETQKQLVVSQAEIAKRAQADYENELAKHGETMKTLRALREQFNTLSTEITQYKTEAEAARVSLSQNEEHWLSIKERQDRELREVREEKDGLNGQNKTLYEQVDTLNNTIKTLQDNRLSVPGGQADSISLDSSLSGLQALNRSLRNDKDILQLKVNGMELEVQRVRQELATKQEQLERSNEKLLAEQAHSQSRPNDAKFKALEESVGQLNLYRESNTTLRNDIQRLEAHCNQKDKELEALRAQLQPLQARVFELEGELEFTSGQLKTVEEDRERWQKRHQDVLQRYDRIDPKELEDLKQQIETLKTERDQASQQADEGFEERIKAAEEEAAKQKAEAEQAHERRKNVVADAREKIGALRTQVKEAETNLANAQTELATVREELQSVRQERDEAQAKANASSDVVMEEEGQVAESNAGLSSEEKEQLEARVREAEDRERQQTNQLEELQTRDRTLEGQVVSSSFANIAWTSLTTDQAELQQRVGVLAKEAQDAKDDKARADAQVAQLQSQQIPIQPTETTSSSELVAQLKEDLAAREKEVEDLRTQAEMADSFVGNGEEAGAKPRTEPPTEQFGTEKAALEERTSALEEREAALAKAESDLQQRKAEIEAAQSSENHAEPATEPQNDSPSQADQIAAMNVKMENLKEKANAKIKKISEEKRKTIEEKDAEISRLQEEVDRLQKEVERLQTEVEQMKQAPPASTVPGPDASDLEIKDFIKNSKTVKEIIDRNIRTKVEQRIEEVTASVRAEEQAALAQKIEDAKTAERNLVETRTKAKLSMAKNKTDGLTAKWNVVVAATKDTPEKPIKDVFDVANAAKATAPAPKTDPTPTQPSVAEGAQSQAPAATTTAPAPVTLGQQQPQAAAGAGPQSNGSNINTLGQLPNNQSGLGNPFVHSMNQGLNQKQFGLGSQQQGGFGAPNPFQNQQHHSRPNSPFGQLQPHMQQPMQQQPTMQPYQPPRGGQNMNIRGQSSIPRAGSGIPIPGGGGGGRGRGGQQQPMLGPNAGAQANQQQLRGGGGGRGQQGGRGRGQQPGSPMNPGANAFVPPGPGGKGQKRGAEDDGTQQQQQQQRGKRHRGGRGGGGAGGDGASAE